MRPRLPGLERLAPYLSRIDAQGVYTNHGPLVRQLEARHAQRLGVDPGQVVALASGTAGLTSAVATSRPRRWVVPSFTFAAPAHAIVNAGRVVELSDVDKDTWQLASPTDDPNVGLLPVLPFGAPVDLSRWPAELDVVIDAASSLGAEPCDLSTLPATWCVAFSLHATKLLSCGEGGLVVCGDVDRADAIRAWSHFALDGSRAALGPGSNAAMPEICAAYGLASLDAWSQDREDWKRARGLAVESSSSWDGLPHDQPLHTYWIARFPDPLTTTRVETVLARNGIATRRWWGPGLHRMPAFRSEGAFPVTELLADTTLGLPFWRDVSAEDAARIEREVVAAAGDALC